MDYTQHATYFPGAQGFHPQFLSMPLTPAHSNANSAGSEEFNSNNNNNTSPPEIYEPFPNSVPAQHDQFPANFDSFVPFNPQQSFPGPPTPPNQVAGHGVAQPGQAGTANSGSNILAAPNQADSAEQSARQGSNSDDDEDVAPAQSKRKAQNRAAQRAFRERKERHVKDLELRLQQLEADRKDTTTENERLKREMQKMSTENEILRATQSIGGSGSPSANSYPYTVTGPMTYNPNEFYSDLLQNHTNKTPSHRVVTSEAGERLLAAGAAWDLIINHELFQQGKVDLVRVSERLKACAKCDGQGPVFEERAITEAIEQSASSDSDELL